jgi:hypothetical protein
MKNTFNKYARKLLPVALVFAAAVTASGCATMVPDTQMSMGPDNIAYIQQGLNFYRQTGASPVNYDACGQLENITQGGGNSGVGTLAGMGVGGVAGHALTHSTLGTVLGIVGGGVLGNSIGKASDNGDVNRLNRDCQLQQAISRESGGYVRGGSVTYQPGGIYRRY